MTQKHPKTGNLIHNCSRCKDTLNEDGEPVESQAVHYVTVPEENNSYIVDSGVAVKHTERTKIIRDCIMEERGVDADRANVAMMVDDHKLVPVPSELPEELDIPDSWQSVNFDTGEELPISIQKSEYVRDEGVDPEIARLDDDVLKVLGDSAEVRGDENVLICGGCLRDADEIHWSGAEI